MSRRRLLQLSAALLGGLTYLGAAPIQAQSAKPLNILFVNADDMGLQMGAYGDPLARTPNLDALASQSVQFTNGYVTQPSCSPSRSSFLTGLYPHQNGQIGLVNRGYRMHDDMTTLPALLHDAGYYNAIIGKLHVAPADKFPFDFKDLGTGKTRDVRGVAQMAGEQMRASGDKPFFLYINYLDPHTQFLDQVEGLPADPMTPAQVKPFPFHPISDDALNPALRESLAGYYNGVARVDIGMGLLMDELRKSGHADDTMVIFIGDHGPPFPRGKTAIYEGGLRIPYLIKWPGQSEAHRDQRLVSTVDLVPTMLQVAGVDLKREAPLMASMMQGRSLAPLMRGSEAPWRTLLFAEDNAHSAAAWSPERSVRDRQFKLIRTLYDGPNPWPSPDQGPEWLQLIQSQPANTLAGRVFGLHLNPPSYQLYDLQNDKWEFNNLAGRPEYAAVEARLKRELENWRRQTDDPLLDAQFAAEMLQAHRAIGMNWDEDAWRRAHPNPRDEIPAPVDGAKAPAQMAQEE